LTAAYAGAEINGGGTTTNTTNYYDYGGFTYNGSASGRQAGLDLRNAVVNANGGLRK
jgi:hypothetical protein